MRHKKEKTEMPVIQSNALVEARYNLPYVAHQLVRYLISMIKPEHKNFEELVYRVDVKEFGKLVGRGEGGSLYEDLKSAGKKLLDTKITIKDGKKTIETTWVASYKYHDDQGYMECSFSSHLQPYLLELRDKFTEYGFRSIMPLSGKYPIRLYEIVRQYLSIGKRQIPLDDLKEILGMEKQEYKHVKQEALTPAHKEINAKTDLRYDWKAIKKARKVTDIQFYGIKGEPTLAVTVNEPIDLEMEAKINAVLTDKTCETYNICAERVDKQIKAVFSNPGSDAAKAARAAMLRDEIGKEVR